MGETRLVSGLNETAADEITGRLVAYNHAHMPVQAEEPHQPQPLHIFAYDEQDRLIGGVTGRTHTIPFWLEVSSLWVDEASRGQGLGTRLMRQAEREAVVERGCRYARLATSDYQAPAFYAKIGYMRYGQLANCPPSETVSYFWKPLTTGSAAHESE
jgi:ribosomal protein S18 acetylase RimI-like enzyme